MRTKIIAALLAVLTCLGGLNLYQSIKDRLFPEAVAYMQDATVESTGKVKVKVREKGKIKVREAASWDGAPASAFIKLTRIEDDDLRSESFTMKKTADVSVVAVGEGTGGRMYDYAWIIDTTNGRRVWEMQYGDTDHAGGGDKNRVFDGRVRLEAGQYRVYYVSDGSHSYDDWNVSAPDHGEFWGVSIYTEMGSLESGTGSDVLAEMTRIGDNEHILERLSLKEETTLQVYAVGEGDSGEMYDYAWIEDLDSGRTVWKMTYRMTDHAGGAEKNRVFSGTITLPAGNYVVNYESDGSHSYEEWNDDLPWDPNAWGVTVSRIDSRR